MTKRLRRLHFVFAVILAGAVFGAPTTAVDAKEFRIMRTGIYALRTDMLMNAMAKELCSCVNVAGLGKSGDITAATEMCLERAQLPMTPGLIKALTGISVDPAAQSFEVDPTLLGALASLFQGSTARARYDLANPQFGCRLLGAATEPER